LLDQSPGLICGVKTTERLSRNQFKKTLPAKSNKLPEPLGGSLLPPEPPEPPDPPGPPEAPGWAPTDPASPPAGWPGPTPGG
jgi:hypothetical protein